MSIVIIVQARMGSERLPGKVLMDISGKPMLWHIIERLKYSKFSDRIVVATSTNKRDDTIEEFCKRYTIDVYRGEEEDVLDRYYQAAKYYKADTVVRITADCPLIDPEVTDRVISGYLENRNNYIGASNVMERTYPRGLDTEALSFLSLKLCWEKAREGYQREHVTIYMYKHPDSFRIYSVKNDKNLSHLRWTVDEEADLEFVRQIYQRLYCGKRVFFMKDILEVLVEGPYLQEINKNIRQKLLNESFDIK